MVGCARFVAPIVLLSLPAPVRADAAPFPLSGPSGSTVPVVYTFTAERDHPEWEFWLVWQDGSAPERLVVPPANPVRVTDKGRKKQEHNVMICYAVPKRMMPALEGAPVSTAWLQKHDQFGNGVLGRDRLTFRQQLSFGDNRERVEITYRIESGPNGPHLVLVWQNSGDPVYRWVRVIPCCYLFPLGLAVFGIWALRRTVRWLRVDHREKLK